MEKQIVTVYVPTDYTFKGPCYYVDKSLTDVSKVIEVKAYLYTPEEHAAVQGYREALEKIKFADALDIAQNIADAALSKAEDNGDNGWISVEDRLPEYMDSVIVHTDLGVITELQYTGDGNKFQTDDYTFTATHWQPLPLPPKH